MDARDLGMAEFRDGTAFADKPFPGGCGGNQGRMQDFQGDPSVERELFSEIDDAKPAPANFADDLKITQCFTFQVKRSASQRRTEGFFLPDRKKDSLQQLIGV